MQKKNEKLAVDMFCHSIRNSISFMQTENEIKVSLEITLKIFRMLLEFINF